MATGTLAKVQLTGRPLVRPLGIIHRRDRKLSDTARRFVQLLQSRAAGSELFCRERPHALAAEQLAGHARELGWMTRSP